jgi:hypothetical protein
LPNIFSDNFLANFFHGGRRYGIFSVSRNPPGAFPATRLIANSRISQENPVNPAVVAYLPVSMQLLCQLWRG